MADDPIIKALSDRVKDKGFNKLNTAAAWLWFKTQISNLKSMNANQYMNQNAEQLRSASKLSGNTIGQMMMFFYDPKLKKELPYFDRFPLIFHIELYPDGFLGINLHYLSPWNRAKLLLELYQTRVSNKNDEMKLKISYQILKAVSQSGLYKPCIKRYLYVTNDPQKPGGVRSRFLIIKPEDWFKVISLPLERFEQGGGRGNTLGAAIPKNKVWEESARQRTGYRPHRRRP